MGQFSWITKNGEQIRNEHHQGQQVWMVYKKDDGSVKTAFESEYEGYGEFGNVDYYEALAEMNGFKAQRAHGIHLAFSKKTDVQFPQLFTTEPSQQEIEQINWFEECPCDPNQGWIQYDDDDQDDESW